MTFQEVLKIAELKFIEDRGVSPSFLLLNVYGYLKLQKEINIDLPINPYEVEEDFYNYKGLQVLVSQDQAFEEFVFAV